MYKLVIIAGPLRGQEYILNNGENIIGKSSEADIQLGIDGISRNHLSITVADDSAYLEDLDSSNGTFVNEKPIKKMTITNGDKIALPNIVMQLVYVEERKIIIEKSSETEEDDDLENSLDSKLMPASVPGKIVYLFKYKFMKVLYGINEEYEWRVLFPLLLSAFVFITISLTVFPVIRDSNDLLREELFIRLNSYADQIARLNARVLEKKNYEQINSDFLEKEPGVSSYELFTLKGRVLRPITRMNDTISDPFSVSARAALKRSLNQKGVGSFYQKVLSDGEIGAARIIHAYNPKTGSVEPEGIIAIRFTPASLTVKASKNKTAYMESLITSAIVAIIFFGIIYYLTTRPIDEIQLQTELAVRGKIRELDGKYLMNELQPLRNSINSMLQRIRELQGQGSDDQFGELEDDKLYVSSLFEMMQGASAPIMVLNSEKNIAHVNPEAEDLTGIRENVSQGESLLDVAKEKGFAATIIELCDLSANNGGTSQKGDYELTGIDYSIYVTTLIGKDNFAKSFYIQFYREA